MKTLFALLLTFTLVSCKAQNQIDIDNLDSLIITNTCLAELCSSNDEIECFAFYFDTKPHIIKANLNHYRVLYSSELRDAGWNPQSPFDLINFRVPIDQYGIIVTWEEWKKIHHIDNDTEEKTLFHYPIEED
jgi:hypothetical protein